MKNNLVLLFGVICSGKTTLATIKYKKYTYIKVSDIVKDIAGATTRQELQNTKDYDLAIAKQLTDIVLLKSNTNNKIVVDGIRQPSIVEYLLKHLGRSWEIDMVWLDTAIEECRRRFYVRAQQRDIEDTFEDAVLRDDELGLNYIPLLYKAQLQYEQSKTN